MQRRPTFRPRCSSSSWRGASIASPATASPCARIRAAAGGGSRAEGSAGLRAEPCPTGRASGAAWPMDVVVVESPTKAKTINKYLGDGYKVLAELRPCPRSAGGGRFGPAGRRLQDDLRGPGRPARSASTRSCRRSRAGPERLILATDPDREGEAISWHLLELLKARKALKGVDVERVVFHEVTKPAVTEAMRHGRALGRASDRRLPGAPRAGLSRRLPALAGAVAQAAEIGLVGRPRAVGGAAADLRARGRDPGVPGRRNTGPSRRCWRRPRGGPSRRG